MQNLSAIPTLYVQEGWLTIKTIKFTQTANELGLIWMRCGLLKAAQENKAVLVKPQAENTRPVSWGINRKEKKKKEKHSTCQVINCSPN